MTGTPDEREELRKAYSAFAHLKSEGDGVRDQMNELIKESAKKLELDPTQLKTALTEQYNIEEGKKAKLEGASLLLTELHEAIESRL
jgi:hypothetical protein